MYIITEEAWEVTNPLVEALPETTGRLFSCVEVDLNIPLWHLDVLVTATNGIECWRRFILTSVEQAVATAADHRDKCRLHFQCARAPGNLSYSMWPVRRISRGRDPEGHVSYLVALPDKEISYPDRGLSVLTDLMCLYDAAI